MKRRRRISALLNKYFGKDCGSVKIVGTASGLVLYEGPLFYVPFGLCDDYVKSYVFAAGRLEIQSTCFPYEDEP